MNNAQYYANVLRKKQLDRSPRASPQRASREDASRLGAVSWEQAAERALPSSRNTFAQLKPGAAVTYENADQILNIV